MPSDVGDAVRMYLRDLKDVKVLPAAQEFALGRRIQRMLREQQKPEPDRRILRDGQQARDEMVMANTRLAVAVARDVSRQAGGQGVSMEDLIGAANEGLMRAAVKYDPEKGFRFSTYATWWIEQSVRRAIAEQRHSPRVPAHVMDTVARLKRTIRQLAQDLGREPSLDEIAAVSEMTAQQVGELLGHAQPVASLDAHIPGDTEIRLGDTIADPAMDMSDAVAESERRDVIGEVMRVLPARTRRVLQFRLGLYEGVDAKEHTLDETALEMNKTRELTRQIEAEGLKWLQGRKAQLRPHAMAV